ncbi:hypothetical protein DdX_20627 [Ditylenchus destructor]|uniref:Uncharacterized protein n=1 Tax=Ditylenchus destructor TaxID=166010 RepID=A0AAD4QW82_9BILA|nr:hypothetical protein DdX_20627 [Ditylenchus destructor]
MERLLLYYVIITAFTYLVSGFDEMNEYSFINYKDKEDKKKSYCTPCKIFMEVVCAPPDTEYAPKCILFTFIPDNMICFVIGSFNDGLCWALTDETKQKGIEMHSYVANQGPAVMEMFNEELSPEEYNKFIARNGYSKLMPLDGHITGNESTENDRDIYEFGANIFQDQNKYPDIAKTVFYADVELKDETWPLFQHFFRLLMDPFIYIRSLILYSPKDVFTLLAGAMNPDRDRLQCKRLNIRLNGDTKKFVVWIKNHVRCNKCEIYLDIDSNYDEEMLDFFMTGAPCTSAIYVGRYDLSKVIVDLVQSKFGITPPYLVSKEQRLSKSCWRWWPPLGETIEEMPFDVREQLPVSKFVRFKSSELLVYNPIESNIDVLSISHVWENQKLTLTCAPNFVWNEEWAWMAAKAKYLKVLNGQGSISYLTQLTSGNCIRF